MGKMIKNLTISNIIIVTMLFLCSGCYAQVRYKDVYVPVKCDVKIRKKPTNNGDLVQYMKELLIYVEGIERDLAYCRGDK